ncbi:polyprenyl diphosphate synthase [Streptomyces sp. S.PNR 29]|uniref:polyprenyl diphosphate synthase n=1 Tax=Streptomyces sp. S.PNR 29 TaxID=2973805 RepID=UPI0025B1B479|nr:polyprenyl diphosphate synthase [Streptomyces sp. S.PNR 29]MDN0200152.1 polyprenyl diphosphate synthase [Streptomyces sp. S.PNR 29]
MPADTDLRAAYRLCRRMTRGQDPETYALIRLLPAALHEAGWALWAAVSAIDDLIDDRDVAAAERAARAEGWIAALEDDLVSGTSTDPIRLALVDTATRWHVDVSALRDGMLVSLDDAHLRHFDDWAQWRTWSRGHVVPTFDLVRSLLGRAGVPVVFRMDRQMSYERFLDGVRLVETLTDLADDLDEAGLLLPREFVEQFPGAEDDLRHRRWTEAAAALVVELTGIARRWVTQPGLTHGMHPGPATVVKALTDLLLAQLDAVETAGPALLRSAARPSLATRARIFVPARIRSALAWSLTPVTVPSVPRRPTATGPRTTAPLTPGTTTFQRPPGHPSGCRPPQIGPEAMPTHVAIIMDGNGRWAEHRGLPRSEGHRAGVAALHEIVYGALEIGLPHLTLYAFSTENWRRGMAEVTGLMDTLQKELADDPFRDLDVRMRWSGHPEKLPADLVESLRHKEATTRTRTGLTCTLCLNYGGRDEITRAAAALARAAKAGDLDPDFIGEDDVARHLSFPDMPSVDLLWRTGGEQRTSNFLPWHATYAELHFTSGYWPDVDRRDLWRAITEYGNRQRRYGTAGPRSAPATGRGTGAGRQAAGGVINRAQ